MEVQIMSRIGPLIRILKGGERPMGPTTDMQATLFGVVEALHQEISAVESKITATNLQDAMKTPAKPVSPNNLVQIRERIIDATVRLRELRESLTVIG
jgi:hypothetical protein